MLPDALEVKPVPPNIPNTSLFRSIAILAEPSVTSKSSAVICVSTKSLTAAEVGTLVSLSLDAIPSDSVTIAEALKLSISIFDNVLLSTSIVLLVKVCDPTRVATVESIAKVTPLPEAVAVKPVPPSKDKVSLNKSIAILLEPSVIFSVTAPVEDTF